MKEVDKRYSFRKLDVWQLAQELALDVIEAAAALPSTPATSVLARQFIASASSVGANIAEGHGRYSVAAYRNHLLIARGSACETDSWLDLLKRGGYLDAETEDRLHRKCDSLVAILTAKIRQLDEIERKRKGKAVRQEPEEYLVE
ncbi:MAG: four helix bundle protein [Dehalococcoidia bacterium]